MADAPPALEAELVAEPPSDHDRLVAASGPLEVTATAGWSRLVERHVSGVQAAWLTVADAGDLLAAVPVLIRRRRGLQRLESSLEGTLGGPLLRPGLDPDLTTAALSTAAAGLAGLVRGRLGVAAVTMAGAARDPVADRFRAAGWSVQEFSTAVVDCRGGLAHVERTLWTNNRRNERNRGLKRGCTLHDQPDPAALADWYPLYRAQAAAWSQAPVPQALMEALLARGPAHARFVHVRLDGEVVAGHVGFVSRGRLVAWQGAARPDLARTHFLTTLLYWGDIAAACAGGLEAVDFGGCVGRDSLWDFKRRCGAQAEPRVQCTLRSRYGTLHGWLADAVRRTGAVR